ncbi:MAG: ATP-binding protein [bacterium]
MSLRSRILLASGILIGLPLILLVCGIRFGMEQRLARQYVQRVETLMAIIDEDLGQRRHDLAGRLATLRRTISEDNRFRLALTDDQPELRQYLLDYAGGAMGLMGLDMLQIQDDTGRIVSSGHFRNEYDREEKRLPRLLCRRADATALATARRPDGSFLALVRCDSLRLGGGTYYLVGGFGLDSGFLASLTRDRDLNISVLYDGGAISSDPELAEQLHHFGIQGIDQPELSLDPTAYFVSGRDLPLIPANPASGHRSQPARLIVCHPKAELTALLRSLDLWLGLLLLATLLGTLLLAVWISGRISRPLTRLARQTSRLDLDRLETDFNTDRRDEVGTLSRFLAAMTERLRNSVARLQEAERRATQGEMARQINHDIRNGLVPIRNVFRHLLDVSREDPESTAAVLQERQATLQSGLGYLDDLAQNYARLSSRPGRQPCDCNAIIIDIAKGHAAPADTAVETATSAQRVGLDLDPELPSLQADPIGLRRVLENLVRNGLDAVDELANRAENEPSRQPAARNHDLIITTQRRCGDDPVSPARAQIVVTVQDFGGGISAKDQQRIFTDFYTTKSHGTGLGLSIVRRLVADFEGEIKVTSEPGRGSTFTLIFPAAETVPGHPSGPTMARESDS